MRRATKTSRERLQRLVVDVTLRRVPALTSPRPRLRENGNREEASAAGFAETRERKHDSRFVRPVDESPRFTETRTDDVATLRRVKNSRDVRRYRFLYSRYDANVVSCRRRRRRRSLARFNDLAR